MRYPTPLFPIIVAKLLGGGGGGSVTPASVLAAMEAMNIEQQADARNAIGAADVMTAIPDSVKQALLECFADVQWADDQGQTHYDNLVAALYPLVSISAVYTPSGIVLDTDSMNALKDDLVVTATYDGGSTSVVPPTDYTLSGSMSVGENTITVTYMSKSTTFTVTVYDLPPEFQRCEWVAADIQNYNLTAYVETGFVPTPKSFMNVKLARTGVSEGRAYFGSRDGISGANKTFAIAQFSTLQKIGFQRWGSSVDCIPNDTAFHTFELSPTAAKVDGVSYALTAPDASQSSTIPIRLFGWWSGGDWLSSNSIKLGDVTLGDDGVVQHIYAPCYRKSDTEIGFYDKATHTFETNDGIGAFTKGADV